MAKPELLCPAGSPETLRSAILGGADAVYLGGTEFNARMNAKNFTRETLPEAIRFCHEKGVRAYITLNTLLTDRQLPQVLDFAAFLYEIGCDALIVADAGLGALLHEKLPKFELHASTQMSGHNSQAAKRLSEKGFSRMVCARELDQKNLALLCQNSPIEIELFVHGAICACHSGQCLMSSMIGGRSGNRGECAQPCRLPYNGSYPLSFKDLSLAGHYREISEMGISSLKIEGRMKSADYVYTTARIFRSLIDENRNATKKEMEMLSGIFSRSGFTDGYFVRNLSAQMLGIRTEEDKKKTKGSQIFISPLKRKLPEIHLQRTKTSLSPTVLPEKAFVQKGRTARFYDPNTIPEGDFFEEIYLPLDQFCNKANGVILPSVIFDSQWDDIRKKLETAVNMGARHALVGNPGHFELLKDLPLICHGDFRLNVTNSFSLKDYECFEDILLSPELNPAQMRDIRGKKSVIVYGRIPLMLLEKPVGCRSLRDRRGTIFPVLSEGKRDLILNSVPIYMADRQKELKDKGLFRQHFIFTTETKKQVLDVIDAYQKGLPPQGTVKRI